MAGNGSSGSGSGAESSCIGIVDFDLDAGRDRVVGNGFAGPVGSTGERGGAGDDGGAGSGEGVGVQSVVVAGCGRQR